MHRVLYVAVCLLPSLIAQTLSERSAVVDARAGTGQLDVRADGEWRVDAGSSWLTVRPASGSGNATITYSYSANATDFGRMATLQVAGRRFTITQASASGAYTPWGVLGRGVIGSTSDVVETVNGASFAPTEYHPPYAVAVDGAGNVYYADYFTQRVVRIDAVTRRQTVVAGTGVAAYGGDGGPATEADLYAPYGLAVDPDGNLYIADTGNSRIRKVTAATGRIETLLGPATVNKPLGVTFRNGNLYIADTSNYRVLKLDSAGAVMTIAGTGVGGHFGGLQNRGDEGPATEISLTGPYGIAVDDEGTVYFTDHFTHRICKVQGGWLSTVVRPGQMWLPRGLARDEEGNLYVAEHDSHRILKFAPGSGTAQVVAGNSVEGYSGDGGAATEARMSYPMDVAVDPQGNLYIAARGNRMIRVVDNTTPALELSPAAAGLPAASGEGMFAVTSSPAGAYWTPVSTAGWLTASREGEAVRYRYTQNTTLAARAATITVGGSEFTVVQAALAAELSSDGTRVGAAAGSDTFSIVLATAAAWTATSSAEWLTLARSSGLGTSSIRFSFSANPLRQARMATIMAGGRKFVVTQEGTGGALTVWGNTIYGDSDVAATLPFQPGGLAADANANLYVSDPAGGTVHRIAAATRARTTIATGLRVPRWLAADSTGSVYVTTDLGVMRYDPATGATTEAAAMLGYWYLTIDREDTLYTANYAQQMVTLRRGEGGRTRAVPLAVSPAGAAVDGNGNLLMTEAEAGRMLRRDGLSGEVAEAITGLTRPWQVTAGRGGATYFTQTGTKGLFRYLPGRAAVNILSLTEDPGALAMDVAGNVYATVGKQILVVDQASPVRKFAPVISQVSPAVSTATERQTFRILTEDRNGSDEIVRIEFVIGAAAETGPRECAGYFEAATGRVQTGAGCAAVLTGVQRDLKTLRVDLTITRSGTDGGTARPLWLRATDAGGESSGWVQGASWTLLPPAATTLRVTPERVGVLAPEFAVVASDANGYFDIERIEVLVTPAGKPEQAVCRGMYDPSGGTFALTEGRCMGRLLKASAEGTEVKMTFSLAPGPDMEEGEYHVFVRAGGDWELGSVWELSGLLSKKLVLPAGNSARVYFVLGSRPAVLANSCHGFWDRATGTVNVYDDALNGQLSEKNSQCEVAVAGVRGEGRSEMVEILFTRRGAYLDGTLNLYIVAVPSTNVGVGTGGAAWQWASVWTASEKKTSTRGYTIARGDAERVYFLVAAEPVPAKNGCHGFWPKGTENAYLYDDDLAGFVFPENSQCGVAKAVEGPTGLQLVLTRFGEFAMGTKNVYFLRTGGTSPDAGWQLVDEWTP